MITKIAHIGITVPNLEEGILFYKSLGFEEVRRFEESEPKLKAVFMDKDGMGLELFEFENISDPKAKIIKNHTALISDNIQQDLRLFCDNGYEVAIPLRNGVTVRRYAFLKDKSSNVFELVEL